MKILQSAAAFSALLALASCSTDTPEYPESSSSLSSSGTVNENLPSYDAVTVENVSVTLEDDYIRGFDASAVDYYEQNKMINGGSVWYDTDRTQKEFFQILKAHGVNTVRLRIWNDPSSGFAVDGTNDDNPPDGDNTLARTLKMASRIKKAGLKLMLDFHYSDYWTDPSKQIVPKAWQEKNLGSVDEVALELYNYTKSVLVSLKSIGVSPDYVQVGNEINSGILVHTGAAYTSGKWLGSGTFDYAGTPSTNLSTYFAAGTKAVRDVCGNDAKVIAHLSISPKTNLSTILNSFKSLSYGGTSVDYDLIGLSYYPFEESHGTVADMRNIVSSWKSVYGKDVFIAEIASPWNATDSSYLENQYTNLSPSEYTDLDTGSTTNQYIGSCQNQANIVRHVIEESADAGAVGVCYWGGESMGTNNWKYSMFEYTGLALPSIEVFNVKGGNTLGVGKTATDLTESSGSESPEETNPVLLSNEEVSITAGGTYQIAISYDTIKEYTTVYVTLAEITNWGETTENVDKPMLGADSSTWKSNTEWEDKDSFTDTNVTSTTGGYFASISPSDYQNGVYITGKTNLSGKLFVTGLK